MDRHLLNDSRQTLNQACSYSFHCILHLWEFTKHSKVSFTFWSGQNSLGKDRAQKYMSRSENDKKSRTVTAEAGGWWRQSLEQRLLHWGVSLSKALHTWEGPCTFCPMTYSSSSQTGECIRITGRLHKTQISNSLGLRWGLRICILTSSQECWCCWSCDHNLRNSGCMIRFLSKRAMWRGTKLWL